jgi:hypothetical protein
MLEMDSLKGLAHGLGNLDVEQRREIYRDLRAGLGLSDTEPMLPLPAPELAAWSRRYAEVLAGELAQHAGTRGMANAARLEAGLLEYAKAADDAFLDAHLAIGATLRENGVPGLYIHSLVNLISLAAAPRVARELLPPASAAIIEQRYPAAVLLRHALVQEGYLGAPKASGGAG